MKNNSKYYTSDRYSSYWLDRDTLSRISESRPSVSLEKLISKYKIIKIIANFVDIINDEGSSKINIKFAGQMSQTNGKMLTISSDVEDFDLLAGLALHEASHLQYSKTHFRIFGKINAASTASVLNTKFLDPEQKFVKDLIDYLCGMVKSTHIPLTLVSYYCLLSNFIEDQRVDNKIISKYPGYEPYYDAINKKYLLSQDAQDSFNSHEGETWVNYFSKILLLLIPSSDLSVLKGLQEISDTINIPNISRLKGGLDVFRLTLNVFKIIRKYVKPLNQQNISKSCESGQSDNEGNNGIPGENDENDENDTKGNNENDTKGNDENDTKGNDNKNKDIENKNKDNSSDDIEKNGPYDGKDFDLITSPTMSEVINSLNNEYDKKELNMDETDAYTLLTNPNVLTRVVKFKRGNIEANVDTILIKNITDRDLLDRYKCGSFMTSNGRYTDHIEAGIKKGKLLARRLTVMNDVKNIDSIRKESGKLDARLLPEFSYGNYKIFKTISVGKYQDTNIHISLDNSGSMSGDNFGAAIEMAMMFAVASMYIKCLEVQISIRSTTDTSLGDHTPYVAIIFNSLMNHNIKYIRTYITKICTTGLTPEGLTFNVIRDYIKEYSSAKNSLFINVSDGAPNCYIDAASRRSFDHFSGNAAIKYTADQIKDIAHSGIKIISFFVDVGSDNYFKDFKKMYGRYSYKTDVIEPLKVANIFNKELKKA